MSSPVRDTIAALATAPGRGGIGVVRVSGPAAARVARAVLRTAQPPAARHARFCRFFDARGGEIDAGIALFFGAPHSYTGEDVLELQGHGGPVVMRALLAACLDAGARLAEPGEFTRRAFLEGKMDLAQAEAVADLIDAATQEAARSAVRALEGELSRAVQSLVDQLVELRALAEAVIDFPDEEVEQLPVEAAAARLAELRAALGDVTRRCRQGSLLRSGISVVLAGRPNVGKSSLLNRLAGEERAIVTPIAGTTRDALREPIQIEGVPIILVDTAGLRDAADEVERIGVERAWREVGLADVVLALLDASTGIVAEDRDMLARLPAQGARIHVFNKTDLVGGAPSGVMDGEPPQVWVSAKTGAGIDVLKSVIAHAAGWEGSGEGVFLAQERHLRALARARLHLEAAERRLGELELFAEELRSAQVALGEITGEFTADDLLGEIFARFCIGK